MSHEILNADLLKWLEEYDGPRFHGVMSDPPYALISVAKRFGKKGSAPAQEGSDGRFTRLSAGFMGQKWDSFVDLDHFEDWVVSWSKLVIEKALHPGAVCMFFGGTRTYHRLARGLERGGFEIIDCLMWLYGAGFPKSHDISKGIDKAAGVEREDLGQSANWRESKRDRERFGSMEVRGENAGRITKPATSEAENWEGYGTALKPAWEPIILCRAPRGNITFAELAKTYGTGALNIDGSRIEGAKGEGIWGSSGETTDENRMFNTSPGRLNYRTERHDAGRWPANLILSHHEDCVLIGEFEIEGRTINRWTEGMKPFGDAAGEEFESEKLPPEMVERWACVGECAIRQLDDQIGFLHGRGSVLKSIPSYGDAKGMFGLKSKRFAGSGISDIGGGPSRFFYSGKASRSEKDKGCEHLFWARKDGEMILISEEEWRKLPKKERAKGNIHPSVKPLELIRYLENLFKPPDTVKSRLLVPFSGSGSEVIAAMQAGWNEVTGIEIDEKYCTIAEARIAGTMGMFS